MLWKGREGEDSNLCSASADGTCACQGQGDCDGVCVWEGDIVCVCILAISKVPYHVMVFCAFEGVNVCDGICSLFNKVSFCVMAFL